MKYLLAIVLCLSAAAATAHASCGQFDDDYILIRKAGEVCKRGHRHEPRYWGQAGCIWIGRDAETGRLHWGTLTTEVTRDDPSLRREVRLSQFLRQIGRRVTCTATLPNTFDIQVDFEQCSKDDADSAADEAQTAAE